MAEFNEIINSAKPTLVDFFASWCGPCKMQAPILQEVKAELGDDVNVVKIDIDANQALAAQHNVRSVPTLILFRNGKPEWRGVGLHTKAALVDKLREYTVG